MTSLGTVDVALIGGGINGTGVARDAAGRGLSVLLCERGDLAQGTSSKSTRLVHGGLRYLEYGKFAIVREALRERAVLMHTAPHLVRPMRFVLPNAPTERPAWKIRLGLFLYQRLGDRAWPRWRAVTFRGSPEGAVLRAALTTGFEYWDCWVDDARLVVHNALDATARGATILTRTAATAARRHNGLWTLAMQGEDGAPLSVNARVLVNAGGPWAEDVIGTVIRRTSGRRVRLIKGSHLVIPRRWQGSQAYVLQGDDKRAIFVVPFADDKAILGTTDALCRERPEDAAPEPAEIDYLLRVYNRFFEAPLTAGDILSTFSAVRALYDDHAAAKSAFMPDYVLELDEALGQPPLFSIFGGKITTCRQLAEHVVDQVARFLPHAGARWTADAVLPGGDFGDLGAMTAALRARHPWLPPALADHYATHYGTRADQMLGDADSLEALGRHFGGLFYEREARFLCETEWAATAEDVLRRRTKHGLQLDTAETQAFERWMGERLRGSMLAEEASDP